MLFQKFTVFKSRNLGEIEVFFHNVLSGRLRNAQLMDDGHGFQCSVVPSDVLQMFALSSSVSATVELQPAAYIRMIFQTHQVSRITVNGRQFDIGPHDMGYFIPEQTPATEMHSNGFRSLLVRIDPDRLRQRLASLCGVAIEGSIAFEQPRRSDGKFLESVRRPLLVAAQELEAIDPSFHHGFIADLQSLMLTRLLLFARHNSSDLLKGPAAPAGASRIDLAEDYIVENWHRTLDVEALAQLSGVSSRTVLRYFLQKHGETPKEYIKRVRLENARKMLLAPQQETTVTAIALKCGFSSLGHFAEAYRRKFGELPSATLRARTVSYLAKGETEGPARRVGRRYGLVLTTRGLPDGRDLRIPVKSTAKNILFFGSANRCSGTCRLVPPRGALRDRHERGMGCGGRDGVVRVRTRGRGCIGHPAFPAPSVCKGREMFWQNSGAVARREQVCVFA